MAKLIVTSKMEIWKEENKGHEMVLNFREEIDDQDDSLPKRSGEENRNFHPETSGYASDSSNGSEKIFRSLESDLKKVSPVVNSAFSIDSILGKQETKKDEVYLEKESFSKRDNNFKDREDQEEGQFLKSMTIPAAHPGKRNYSLLFSNIHNFRNHYYYYYYYYYYFKIMSFLICKGFNLNF